MDYKKRNFSLNTKYSSSVQHDGVPKMVDLVPRSFSEEEIVRNYRDIVPPSPGTILYLATADKGVDPA